MNMSAPSPEPVVPRYMNLEEWVTLPGDRALRSALAKADSVDDPSVLDYQKNKLDTALSFVKEFHTAVDAGANYGIVSFNLNNKFSKVYAFEIETSVRECLKKNVGKFQLKNVVVCDCGLSDKEESVALTYEKTSFGTHVNRTKSGDFVCNTLDSFDLTDISFIKIDCEGYEPFILAGAEKTIKKYLPVIFMEDKGHSKRYYGTEGNLAVELLLSWGYKIAQQWPKDCVMIYAE